MRLRRSDFLAGTIPFFISLVVYIKTLCPTIYVGDSPALITASYTLGIGHPPGYPLWCLLAKLFTFLPIGDVAYRVNLMVAFLSSLTVYFLFLIIVKSLRNRIAAVTASLLFAFSREFWDQSLFAEVYSLNAFFIVTLIFLVLVWEDQTKQEASSTNSRSNVRKKYLWLISFIYGLSLTNHHSMVLFLPPLLFWIFLIDRRSFASFKLWSGSILFFFLGLFVYLYLPFRSLANPALDWGNPETLSNFLKHIFRAQYGSLSSAPRSLTLFSKQLFFYLRYLCEQFTPFLIWLCLPGIWALYKNDKKFFSATIIAFLFYSLGMIIVLNQRPVAHKQFLSRIFFIPSYIIAAIWLGYGISFFMGKLGRKAKKVAFLLLILPIIPLTTHYYENDKSRNYFVYDYGLNVLKTLDNKAVLITRGDNNVFPILYFQIVEGMRPDVFHYEVTNKLFQQNDLRRKWEKILNIRPDGICSIDPGAKDFIFEITKERSIYLTFQPRMTGRDIPGIQTAGFLYKLQEEKIPLQEINRIWEKYELRGIEDSSIYQNDYVREIIPVYYYYSGEYAFSRGEVEQAKISFRKASEIASDVNPHIHRNLGITFEIKGWYDEAISEFESCLQVDPNDSFCHAQLSRLYFKKLLLDRAISEYRRLLDIDPTSLVTMTYLGDVLKLRGSFQEALKIYREALSLDRSYPLTYYNLGLLYMDMDQPEEALKIFQKGLKVAPRYSRLHLVLAAAYKKIGDNDKAIRAIDKAREINPDLFVKIPEEIKRSMVYSHFRKALYHEGKREYDRAIEECEQALKIAPDNLGARNELVKLYTETGLFDEAISEYWKAISTNPDVAELHFNLATLCWRKNMWSECVEEFRRTLKLDPDYPRAKEFLRKAEKNL